MSAEAGRRTVSLAHRHVVLRPATDDDAEFAFAVKRAALGAYVAQVWGWDDDFQRAFHAADWAARRPDIVESDGTAIGTMDVHVHADGIDIGELYLLPSHQRRGIGTELLRRVLERADAEARTVRLQFLKVNPVRTLYERHGFRVVGETSTHFLAERAPAAGARRR